MTFQSPVFSCDLCSFVLHTHVQVKKEDLSMYNSVDSPVHVFSLQSMSSVVTCSCVAAHIQVKKEDLSMYIGRLQTPRELMIMMVR